MTTCIVANEESAVASNNFIAFIIEQNETEEGTSEKYSLHLAANVVELGCLAKLTEAMFNIHTSEMTVAERAAVNDDVINLYASLVSNWDLAAKEDDIHE